MLNLSNVVSQLHAQRKHLQSELGRLDAAINALRGSDTSNGSGDNSSCFFPTTPHPVRSRS